jgi:UDP-glucose 4-epimerase
MTTKRRFLITGVAGFVGSHVAHKVQDAGHDVVGVDDFSTGYAKNIPEGIEFIEGDLSEKDLVRKIPRGCEVILHIAGQSSGEISFDNPTSDLKKNAISTLNLIEYGIENKSERLVLASSMSVYGDTPDHPISEAHPCTPLSCYGVSKLTAEHYLDVFSHQLPYVSLRMFNIYGPGQDMSNLRQGMVSIFVSQALKNGVVEIKGDLQRYRDFIFIDDVVELWYRCALDRRVLNRCLNVGTGVRTTVEALIKQVVDHLPGVTHYIGAPTPGDQTGIFADMSTAKSFGFLGEPTSLTDGLRAFIDHYQQSNWE